jgi:hypothetical protein
MEDIVATLRVETRRVAVRSTDWLGVTWPSLMKSEKEFFEAGNKV